MLLQKYYNRTGQFITSMPALLKKNISYLLLTLLAISWPGFNARAGVGFDRQQAEAEQLRLLSQAASRADSPDSHLESFRHSSRHCPPQIYRQRVEARKRDKRHHRYS